MPESTASDLRQQPNMQRALADLNQQPTLRRVFNRQDRAALLTYGLLIGFVVIPSVFTNWYTTLLSLGVVSLILGIALQNPIASFFAWVYILLRRPYSVGNRVKIGDATGDMIDVGYFDTTLWEFNGDYLSGDHSSGRVIRFANLKVFSEYIFNYFWPLFPYIWNEIKFYVAHKSDLDSVGETVRSAYCFRGAIIVDSIHLNYL